MFSTLEVVKPFSQLMTRVKSDIYSMVISMDGRDSAVNTRMTTYHSILSWVILDLDMDRDLILNYSLLFIR